MPERTIALILTAVILGSLLSGCFDSREIDDEVYAISVGVDKGLEGRLRLTIQYPTYKGPGGAEGSGGSTGDENKKAQSNSLIHTIEAPTMLEAIDMLSASISRRVSLIHAKWVIFSEEYAREGIEGYIAGLERYKETRPSMSVVVVRGTAEEFITENESSIGGSLSKSVELLLTQSRFTGIFPMVEFMDFHTAMISPYKCPIALYGGINDFDFEDNAAKLDGRKGFIPGEIPRSSVTKREIAGMAVFHTGRMVGYLDAYETAAYLMIKGQYKSGMMSVPDKKEPGKNIIFDVHKSRPTRIKAYFKDGKPTIDVIVDLEAEIYAIQGETKYEKLDLTRELENQIRAFLLDSIKHTIKKTQEELKADIFGFGENMAGNFFTIEEWESFDWFSQYPDAEINPSLKLKIRRTGTIFQSYKKVKSGEGDND
jgi:spore germination protein KC